MTQNTITPQLQEAARTSSDWRDLSIGERPLHIAVMREPFLSCVWEETKTVESRFSIHKIAPYQRVQPGDLVLMKAGPIVGCFTAGWVKYFDFETDNFDQMVEEYGEAVHGDDEFWQAKRHKRYATLIEIRDVKRLTPMQIPKSDRRAWLTLDQTATNLTV